MKKLRLLVRISLPLISILLFFFTTRAGLITIYKDADGDGYWTEKRTIDSADPIPIGWRTGLTNPVGDCDDGNNLVWKIYNAYKDADGDGYVLQGIQKVCAGEKLPPDYRVTPLGYDCDDTDKTIWLNKALYRDSDGDGYTIPGAVTVCMGNSIPPGYKLVQNGNDCDDKDNTIWKTVTVYKDADMDGYTIPGPVSLCIGSTIPVGYKLIQNGNDCKDDDNTIWKSVWLYRDADNDGYTIPGLVSVCIGSSIPPGYKSVQNGNDCNDNDNSVWRSVIAYVDNDGDGYTEANGYIVKRVTICIGATYPPPYVALQKGYDCDDNDKAVWNRIGLYRDKDMDGYTAPGLVYICIGNEIPPGYKKVPNGVDCDDDNPNIWRTVSVYIDADKDGYTKALSNGTTIEIAKVCIGNILPEPYVWKPNGLDCDDADPLIWRRVLAYVDKDKDGYTNRNGAYPERSYICIGASYPYPYVAAQNGMDCDDNNATIWQTKYVYRDQDLDGYTIYPQVLICMGNNPPPGYKLTPFGNDCNDTDPTVWRILPVYPDLDGDGYTAGNKTGPATYSPAWVNLCVGDDVSIKPPYYLKPSFPADCDDSNPNIWENTLMVTDNDGDFYTPAVNRVSKWVCIGKPGTWPSGFTPFSLIKGIDCDDNDPTRWSGRYLFGVYVCTTIIRSKNPVDIPSGKDNGTISMYPNPARSIVNLMPSSSYTGKMEIRIVDQLGKMRVSKIIESPANGQVIQLDVSQFNPGIYNVIIVRGDIVETKKLVIQQ